MACTNYASNLIDSQLPVIFDNTHLALLIGVKPNDLRKIIWSINNYLYNEVNIPKKSGGKRRLLIPSATLKIIQRWILDNILIEFHVSSHATGFREGNSIVTNAKPHVGKECVINLDIENFFPSISIEKIFQVFYYYGYTKEVSYTLSRLCTYEGFLPQGSPASPCLSNIVCLKLDKRLSSISSLYSADYTRYADDITVSGNKRLSSILPFLIEIIQDEGYKINQSKLRLQYSHQKQVVTGLNVNGNTIKVSRKYKRQLLKDIYYCQKYGVNGHQQRIGDHHNFYKEHLYGKAYFINMIEPEIGEIILNKLDQIEWDY